MVEVVRCENLDDSIKYYMKEGGFRLDMITPADAPRIALVSKNGETIRLVSGRGPIQGKPLEGGTQNNWVTGRAGMMYRDLIPGREDGQIAASHIKLSTDGPVPDYVHYHKIRFQMIYCLQGRIRVVYEDQGPPFWLEAGDCVLQPPEIRHRVLESVGGAEVVEVSMPAAHETWVEHAIKLPTPEFMPDRDFGGQRFRRHVAADAGWRSGRDGLGYSDTGIANATHGFASARDVRSTSGGRIKLEAALDSTPALLFCFVMKGELNVTSQTKEKISVGKGQGLLVSSEMGLSLFAEKDTRFLEVLIRT